jgi:hypothetical protein
MYVSFSSTDENGIRTMMLADINNVHVFAQKFLAFAPGTRQHVQWCSSVHRALFMSGDVTTLPYLPLAVLFAQSFYSIGAFVILSTTACIPIPFGKVLDD